MRRFVVWVIHLFGRWTCEDVVTTLHDYYEHTLDPEMTKIVEQHLRDCPDCDAFAESYETLIQLTGELACDDIPEEVQRRVHEALEERYQGI